MDVSKELYVFVKCVPPTFQLADLRLTVRPLLVTVHFILMKKSLSVFSSLCLLPYTGPNSNIQAIPYQYKFFKIPRTLFIHVQLVKKFILF